MSKANEKALDWLPKRKDGRKRFYQCNDDGIRDIYARGYRKAEKDLELTWEDIETIQEMANKYCKYHSCEPRVFVYSEVLKRFKNLKEKS